MAISRIPADAVVIGVKVLLGDPRGNRGEGLISLEEFAALFDVITVTDGRTYERKVLRVLPTGSVTRDEG